MIQSLIRNGLWFLLKISLSGDPRTGTDTDSGWCGWTGHGGLDALVIQAITNLGQER